MPSREMTSDPMTSGAMPRSPPPNGVMPKSAVPAAPASIQAEFGQWLKNGALRHISLRGADGEAFEPLLGGLDALPDYLVLLDAVGLLAVEVHDYVQRGPEWKGSTVKIGSTIRLALAFERNVRIPYWYAFRECEDDRVVWHWISAVKAFEVGKVRTTERAGDFLSLQPHHLERVVRHVDMARLYAPRLIAPPPRRHHTDGEGA